MYEFQIGHGKQRAARELLGEVAEYFVDHDSAVTARSVDLWEEHCTECAWPDCYSSCELYEARMDGHCRRFVQGSVPVTGLPGQACFVEFKRWAKLEADVSVSLVADSLARPLGQSARVLDRGALALRGLRLAGREQAVVRLQTRLKRLVATEAGSVAKPDYFLVELAPVTATTVSLTLSIRGHESPALAFQERIRLDQPFTRLKIPFEQIVSVCGQASSYRVELAPNIDDPSEEGLGVVFGEIGFVADESWKRPQQAVAGEKAAVAGEQVAMAGEQGAPRAPAVKAVIWDLDGTLWDGVLVEDQLERLRLRQAVAAQIVELDRRGIVNSVCSKNDPALAAHALEHFGLSEYMVFPAVSWNPKSEGVAQIVAQLNIAPDTIVFVDDQPFERAEVEASHPEIRVIDGSVPPDLVSLPEFSPRVSGDSSERRRRYQQAAQRQQVQEQSGGDYRAFLIDSGITMRLIERPVEHADRVYELLQRTNQMNFSGRRLTSDQLESALADLHQDSFLVEVTDRFGDYGFVGFALVDTARQIVTDLAFSCRVQSKTVEHALLSHLLARYGAQGWDDLSVVYRATDRNGPVGKVFGDLGFAAEGSAPELMVRATTPVPEVDTVTVESEALTQ